jgi:hypothetical protein
MDRRVLFGIFGFVDIPIIILLVILFSGVLNGTPPPTVCKQLDPSEFRLEKHTGWAGGEIDEDTRLGADTEYLIQDTLVVPQAQRLLIEEGARLIFAEGAGLEVHGALYVCGSSKNPVTFTSDERTPGSWGGIRFLDAEDESILSHALIQFAGDRALYLEDSSPQLVDVEIAQSNFFAISIDGNALPQFSPEKVDIDDNPLKGIEVRAGTLDKETIEWLDTGFVYILSGPVEVGANTTLEIAPGTIVKFWQIEGADTPELRVRGLLKAENVWFTSVHDDGEDVGGVSYLAAQGPAPGDWGGITFYESSNKSYLRRCQIRYAGRGRGAVAMLASAPELDDVTISDAAWYPLSADADSFPILRNIRLDDNEPGDAMEIRGGSAVTDAETHTWSRLGDDVQIVRVIRGDVTVQPQSTLVIEPGVVVKFEEKGRLLIKGTLQAVGGRGDEQEIIFTSLRDEDYGGDTDKATGPQDPRKWDGIAFEQVNETSIMENVIVRYGSLAINGGSPRFIDVSILESGSAAIWQSPGATPELTGIRFQDNAIDGVAIWKGDITHDLAWHRLGDNETQLVRVLTDRITIGEGATLVIDPGVVIKANPNGYLRVFGGLQAYGDSQEPVTFTSLNDDQAGDTNQKLQAPSPGDWPGLEIGARSHTRFSYVRIRYAKNGLVLRDGNTPTIEGWVIASDGEFAVWCNANSDLPPEFRAEGNWNNTVDCPRR